ncbi:ArpU family phage packaging/lysis transcriptional regulator [Enterococcus sp. LJL90]
MVTLFREIDEKKTKDNVRKLLSRYRSANRLSGGIVRTQNLLQSPKYSDMPTHRNNANGVEKNIIYQLRNVSKDIAANELVHDIDCAIDSLPTISQQILDYSYRKPDRYRLRDIAARIVVYEADDFGRLVEKSYSVKSIELYRDTALIEFAEAYHGGELFAFKN